MEPRINILIYDILVLIPESRIQLHCLVFYLIYCEYFRGF